jgi:hypothetical protein
MLVNEKKKSVPATLLVCLALGAALFSCNRGGGGGGGK